MLRRRVCGDCLNQQCVDPLDFLDFYVTPAQLIRAMSSLCLSIQEEVYEKAPNSAEFIDYVPYTMSSSFILLNR